MHETATRHASYWIESTPATAYPRLHGTVRADICVVGGGIAGILTATLLAEAGVDVVLVEAERVAASVTGHTTAKVTSQHGPLYHRLDPHRARIYGEANQAGLRLIDDLRQRHAIDCDFERRPAYVYAADHGAVVESLQVEARAAAAAGLPAGFVDGDIGLPFPVAGAVRFEDQAQFHPRRFLLPLAARLPRVYEETPVTSLAHGDPCRLGTPDGAVIASHVVLATHIPFPFRGAYFAKAFPYRSYAIAAALPAGEDVTGMYISADTPTRSIRTAPHEGGRLVIVGGEGHKVGTDAFTDERYARLTTWTGRTFPTATPAWRWSTQDLRSADGVPFVGPLATGRERVLVATAFGKWGMTNAAVAAMILRDRIRGTANPWAEVFSSTRLTALTRGARTLATENLEVARHLAEGHLGMGRRTAASADDLRPGEGAIIRGDAVYRAPDGRLHAVRARCTHMGCVVDWNPAEASWDCPCHGSRFDVDGNVLEGPALAPLEPVDVSQRAA